jgi:LysR family glycine cleavage system transcriptional activator
MPSAHAVHDTAACRQLPPLTALRCFTVAARTGSFTRAAEELCVTQSAVSRQVILLEEFYGQPLFLRQARGIELTEAGRQLAETAQAALDQIARTTRLLRRRVEARELRFMIPTCAMLWAIPLVTRFTAEHPDFRIAVITTMSHVLDEEQFDGGIVYAALDSGAPRQRLLFAEMLTPVCSPRLREGAAALRTPAELARCVLLHARADHEDWRQWLDVARLTEVDARSGLDFQTLDSTNSAAAEGYGVALGDRLMLQRALDSARLVAPFPLDVATGKGYFMRWREQHAQREEFAQLARTFEHDIADRSDLRPRI